MGFYFIWHLAVWIEFLNEENLLKVPKKIYLFVTVLKESDSHLDLVQFESVEVINEYSWLRSKY